MHTMCGSRNAQHTLKPHTYVPPQNSMEVREPAALSGSFSRSSTGIPIDTTRTGSGYVSSNTARRPWMALACASGASKAYTAWRGQDEEKKASQQKVSAHHGATTRLKHKPKGTLKHFHHFIICWAEGIKRSLFHIKPSCGSFAKSKEA